MANTLIARSVGMLPGASAEHPSLSMNVKYIKNQAASILLIQPTISMPVGSRTLIEGTGILYSIH